MSFATDITVAAGLVAGLRSSLRQRLTLAEARDLIRRRLDEREPNFLSLVERGIFGFPASPYRALLKDAGCAFGDLERMVRTHGLEHTLARCRV